VSNAIPTEARPGAPPLAAPGALPRERRRLLAAGESRSRRRTHRRVAAAMTACGDALGGALVGVAAATVAPSLPATWTPVLGFLAAPVLLAAAGMGRASRRPGLRGPAFAALRAGAALSLGFALLAARAGMPGWSAVIAAVASVPVAAGMWLAIRSLLAGPVARRQARGRRRLLVVGGDRGAVATEGAYRDRGHDDELVGYAGAGETLAVGPRAYLGGYADVPDICRDGDVDRILVVRPDLGIQELLELGTRLAADDREVLLVSEEFRPVAGRAPLTELDGRPVYVLRPTPLTGARALLKRTLDVVGASVGILLLSPLLVAIAVAVTRSSPGPVLFRQERIGRDGRRFWFLKFRSMKTGVSSDRHREYVTRLMTRGDAATETDEGEQVFKLVDDPRITPVGRFIRRTSLDELPQLWNVLRGEMSLVGPRPCVPYEWDLYQDWYRHRFDVTPGCTGLWQVKGRSAVDIDGMMLLDLHYAAHWTFGGDLKLILATIPVMVLARGAH